MLMVAEETGSYATALGRTATYLKARAALVDKAAGAAVYPAFVLLLTIAGALALITVVFPAAGRFMAATGALSSAEIDAILASGVTALAIFLGVSLLTVLSIAALACSHQFRLRLPVIGPLERTAALLAFSESVAGMQAVGFPLERAVTMAAGSLTNRYLGDRLRAAGAQIANGVAASAALAAAVPRASHMARWFALAEHGADPLAATEGLISFLQAELTRRTERLGSLLEPLFVVLAGLMIIIVVVTLIQPLFGLYAEVLP